MMAGGKPGGWSRFTRLHRSADAGGAEEADSFPALVPFQDGRSGWVAHSGGAPESGSFAAATKKGLASSEMGEDEGASLESQVYGRLRAMGMVSSKAGGLEGATSAVEDLSWAYPWAEARVVADVVTAVEGDREMAAACLDSMAPPSAPVEAESEWDGVDDDVYMKYRREAVQASR